MNITVKPASILNWQHRYMKNIVMLFDVELEIKATTAKYQMMKGMDYKMGEINGISELCFKEQAFSQNEKSSDELQLFTNVPPNTSSLSTSKRMSVIIHVLCLIIFLSSFI